jgi:hypothetical protein
VDNWQQMLAAHRLMRCGRVENQKIRSSAYLPENIFRSEELQGCASRSCLAIRPSTALDTCISSDKRVRTSMVRGETRMVEKC